LERWGRACCWSARLPSHACRVWAQ